jgi:galactoside O-acetyltransferase
MDAEPRFAERGHDVTLYPHSVFVLPEHIHLGSQVIVSEFVWIHGGIATAIGNFVHVAPYSSVAGGGLCLLEDFSGLGAGVRLITGSEIMDGRGLTNPTVPPAYRAVTRSFVHVGRYAVLATNVIVLPGVTIGEGAIVGAGAIVSRDVEPWTINAGSPARAIAKRPADRIRELAASAYADRGVHRFDIERFLPLKVVSSTVPPS